MSIAKENAGPADQADDARADLMEAVVQDRFGPPHNMQLLSVDRPEIGAGEVFL